MEALTRGRYCARQARGPADLDAVQRLRQRCFRPADTPSGRDSDRHDAGAEHLMVERLEDREVVCTLRLTRFCDGAALAASYSAQRYDLAPFAEHAGPFVEMGRVCAAPGTRDADVLRLAWCALAGRSEAHGALMLFGCSSFAGTKIAPHVEALTLLKDRHLAPRAWRPRVKARPVIEYARLLRGRRVDLASGQRAMPPLLRTYLALGGCVSDHLVIDRDLGTLHVFTGLDCRSIPTARSERLRAI